MMTNNAEQLMRLFLSAGFGMCLSLYHTLLYLRAPHAPHRLWKLACLDWFFAVSGGVMLFFFLLAVHAGIARLGMLTAIAVGFFVGKQTLGRLTVAVVGWLTRVLCRVAARLRTFCLRTASFFQNLCKKIALFSKKYLHSVYTMVYNRKR